MDNFKQKWFNEIENSRSLSTYKVLKNNFEFENYLDMLPKKLRIFMTRLRLSSHQLKIETGRYAQNRIERNLRYCTLCDSLWIYKMNFIL